MMALLAFSALSCADPYEEPIPRRDRLNWPIGLEVHPEGRFLYVVNSNFDTRYREDVGGTLSVIDLETLEIRPTSGPFLPSFGGYVRLNRDASKAYVSARHSNAIVAFDVSPSGHAIYCDAGEDGQTSNPAPCAMRRVPDQDGSATIPSDPFALDVTTLDWTGPGGEEFEIDLLNTAHLRGDNVTSIAVPRADGSDVAASMKSAALLSGGATLARRPGTRDIYVGGRVSRSIAVYYPYLAPETGAVQAIVRRDTITLGNIGQTVDTRGLTFSEDGETLYVVTRAPDVLHIVDLGPSNAETGGGTLGKVTSSIALPRNPSGVHLHTGADGRDMLYIPSYDEQRIVVFDPASQTTIAEVDLGARPYDFVVDTAPGTCVPGARCRAYVSLFDDLPKAGGTCQQNREQPCGSIGIIDLNPESDRYHQLIGKVQ